MSGTPPIIVDGWILVDSDPATGRKTWMLEEDGKTHFRVDYPMDAVIDENERMYNESLHQRFGNGRIVARIPLNEFHDKLAEAVQQDDQKFISKFLNDSDNRKFRTFRGKL